MTPNNSTDLLSRPNEVHIWAVSLTAPEAVNRAYRALLSPAEVAHADGFAFERLRRSYEVSHGALRLLLARYAECCAQDVVFAFGSKGKPSLRGVSRIRFNMSHSGDLALYAFAADCEVGIDVEEAREMSDIEQMSSQFFCSAETTELLSICCVKSRLQAFFRCWTRKEAYIKAIGDGLYLPLDQFQVTLLRDEPVRFVHIGGDPMAAVDWTLQHIEPFPDYIGALAYRSRPRDVVFPGPLGAQELLDAIG
jgi:4'-phosphopantetheinyl transferase